MAMTKAVLKKELNELGIKTYRNIKTKASFVRKGDVKKVLTVIARQDQLNVVTSSAEKHFQSFYEENEGMDAYEKMIQAMLDRIDLDLYREGWDERAEQLMRIQKTLKAAL